jgi:hypothetical protein
VAQCIKCLVLGSQVLGSQVPSSQVPSSQVLSEPFGRAYHGVTVEDPFAT